MIGIAGINVNDPIFLVVEVCDNNDCYTISNLRQSMTADEAVSLQHLLEKSNPDKKFKVFVQLPW